MVKVIRTPREDYTKAALDTLEDVKTYVQERGARSVVVFIDLEHSYAIRKSDIEDSSELIGKLFMAMHTEAREALGE